MSDPAFLFYSDNWLGGTALMNFYEKGQYIELLALMHLHGRMPLEQMELLVGTLSESVRKKFKIDDEEKYYSVRLEKTIHDRKTFSELQSEKGKLGAKKRWGDNSPAIDRGNDPANNRNIASISNSISNSKSNLKSKKNFEIFWKNYEPKKGKVRAHSAFTRLSQEDQKDAIDGITPYQKANPDPKYWKHPASYLNQRTWEDEIGPTSEKFIQPFPEEPDTTWLDNCHDQNLYVKAAQHWTRNGWERLGNNMWTKKKKTK